MIVLGAMSGTSTDGLDVAALRVSEQGEPLAFLGHHTTEFPAELRAQLLRLQEVPGVFETGSDPFAWMLNVRQALSRVYAQGILATLQKLNLKASDVQAVGVHGQTVRHRPDLGWTWQVLEPASIAAQVSVPVVADFRSADVALGGQGAPLVPPFHAAWLRAQTNNVQAHLNQHTQIQAECAEHIAHTEHVPEFDRVNEFSACGVLNLGGFANLTRMDGLGQVVGGGDCGPANVLMDWWAQGAFGVPFDRDGAFAAQGQVIAPLLGVLLQHPYFARPWPKSTGRDDFTEEWALSCLNAVGGAACLSPVDVMATLLELTVETVARCCEEGALRRVVLCGGGAANLQFRVRLSKRLPSCVVECSDVLGLPTTAVEACAFAWLAAMNVLRKPANCPVVTGASRLAVLGALYWP